MASSSSEEVNSNSTSKRKRSEVEIRAAELTDDLVDDDNDGGEEAREDEGKQEKQEKPTNSKRLLRKTSITNSVEDLLPLMTGIQSKSSSSKTSVFQPGKNQARGSMATPGQRGGLLKVETLQSKLIREIIYVTALLMPEGQLRFAQDGFHVHAQDMTQVCFWAVHLSPKLFTTYLLDTDIALGQSFRELKSVMKSVLPKEHLSIEYNRRKNVLYYTFEGSRKTINRLNILDMKLNTDPEPSVAYETCVQMQSSEFAALIRRHRDCGSVLRLDVDSERVIFSTANEHRTCSSTLRGTKARDADRRKAQHAKNQEKEDNDELLMFGGAVKDADGGHVVKKNGGKKNNKKQLHRDNDEEAVEEDEREDNLIVIRCKEPLQQNFGLIHLETFTKGEKISDTIRLHMMEDQPLMLEYLLDDGKGTIRYYIKSKLTTL